LRQIAQNAGPAKGTISGALVVLQRLQEDYDLDIDHHTAKSGTQIQGASGRAVSDILAMFGEVRQYVAEGGRTNRGLRSEINSLLRALAELQLEALEVDERNRILQEMQRLLVTQVQIFFNRQRLSFEFDPTKSVQQLIRTLLRTAEESGKEGPVAQYLVGAKLALRFPDENVANQSYSTADQQTARPGDFTIRDTAFHVTVAPQFLLFEKCKRNLADGLRVYVLVPERILEAARQFAEQEAPGRITTVSIESFTAQNIEEMAYFSNSGLVKGLHALLEAYNIRTDQVEIDKSMLIEIPTNLRSSSV
jgi:hypothetical protein